MTGLRNWAGNHRYRAARLHAPATLAQLRQIVRDSRRVRVLGSRHSFNAVADGPEDLVSLDALDQPIAVDGARGRVSVGARCTYGRLGRHLHRAGYALHNMASLPHISVAGACATATHGSGDRNGNLATAVAALEVINAAGELVEYSRSGSGESFAGMPVSLGGLGAVVRLTLDIEPAYEVRQGVYQDLPWQRLLHHFDAITASAYSVSAFTNWQPPRCKVWLKQRLASDAAPLAPELFGAPLAREDLHPLAGLPAANCTRQGGVPGPWHEQLPHFRLDFTPSSGAELQSEYFVPRQHAVAALAAVGDLRESIAPHLLVSEIRTVAADDLWLSPCYRRDAVAIHFTWKPDGPAVDALLPRIEEALAPFAARPHWGKLFAMAPEQLRAQYEKLQDFRRLLQCHDPAGKFRNPFLDTYIFAQEP